MLTAELPAYLQALQKRLIVSRGSHDQSHDQSHDLTEGHSLNINPLQPAFGAKELSTTEGKMIEIVRDPAKLVLFLIATGNNVCLLLFLL